MQTRINRGFICESDMTLQFSRLIQLPSFILSDKVGICWEFSTIMIAISEKGKVLHEITTSYTIFPTTTDPSSQRRIISESRTNTSKFTTTLWVSRESNKRNIIINGLVTQKTHDKQQEQISSDNNAFFSTVRAIESRPTHTTVAPHKIITGNFTLGWQRAHSI